MHEAERWVFCAHEKPNSENAQSWASWLTVWARYGLFLLQRQEWLHFRCNLGYSDADWIKTQTCSPTAVFFHPGEYSVFTTHLTGSQMQKKRLPKHPKDKLEETLISKDGEEVWHRLDVSHTKTELKVFFFCSSQASVPSLYSSWTWRPTQAQFQLHSEAWGSS